MTAFSEAWSLLKMPITSPITDEQVLGGIKQRADFTDPETGEVMDLSGYDLGDSMRVEMKRLNLPSRGERVGRIRDDLGFANIPNHYRNTDVEGGFRRRGVGTALYEMLAHLYAKRGFEVKPTKSWANYNLPALTGDGAELWGDKETWPARDDL